MLMATTKRARTDSGFDCVFSKFDILWVKRLKILKKASEDFTVFNSQSTLEVGGMLQGQTVKNGFVGKILGLKFNGIQILDQALKKSKDVSLMSLHLLAFLPAIGKSSPVYK